MLNVYPTSPRGCLTHLESMSSGSNALPTVKLLRTQMANALHVIVHIARLRDGSRKILNIVEVQGFDGSSAKLQSIFHFRNAGYDKQSGKVEVDFEASGFIPTFLSKFEDLHIKLPREMFKSPCYLPGNLASTM